MLRQENATWWQGYREIFPDDIVYIRTFVKRFPGLSRTELTCTLCEHLDWLTPAGRPKFEACAKLLARMEEAGELRLPSLRQDKSHPGPRSCAPRRASARTDPPVPLVRSLSELDAVRLRLASDPEEESVWNDAVERYHLLGYKKPFGYWGRYFIESGGHWLGCILLSGAAKALTARDRWIGWNDRQRLKNLPWAANGEITRPMFEHNLRLLFPQLGSLPHADTLFRLLCRIDVGAIEQAHIELVNHLIRNKKFSRYLINNCYPIGIDGTQKIAFSALWDEHLLQRRIGPKPDPDSDEEQSYQYYVYVLEASLCFRNGMVIPLMSDGSVSPTPAPGTG